MRRAKEAQEKETGMVDMEMPMVRATGMVIGTETGTICLAKVQVRIEKLPGANTVN